MGKQSSRIYYRRKDHKDIYFQGVYHNAMIVRKEGDAELVWRKLYDEGYFVYTRQASGFYTAILYPKYRIREYHNNAASNTYYSDRYLVRKYAYSSAKAIISSDGKLWKSIGGNSGALAVIPKGDGVVVLSKQKYTYIPILESLDADEENSLVIFSDDEAGAKTGNSIFNTAGITDFCLLLNGSLSPVEALAVHTDGSIYRGLFTANTTEVGGSGCYNGMYYCAFNNIPDGSYVYVSNNGRDWERRGIPVKGRNLYTIQSDKGIIVYISSVNNNAYSPMHIYSTTDFVNYTRIDFPDSIVVPIIGQIYNAEKSSLNLKLSPSATDVDGSYNPTVYTSVYGFLSNMTRRQICYIEKGKISPPKGMIMDYAINLINMTPAHITIYLDNLFFRESDGNFAFFEGLYPESYMNDYLEITNTEGSEV